MKTLFLGDISPTEVTAPLFREKKTAELFQDTQPLYKNRDFVCANLECALTDSDKPIQKFGPALKAPRETAVVLKEIGVTLCGLSNNHVFDYGRKGITDTFSALKEAGLFYTGFGENEEESRRDFTFEKDGERLAVLAVCEHEYSYALPDRMGSRPFDPIDTLDDVRRAKATHDRVVVLYHGGKEQCRYPSPRLIKVCRAMAKAGADLILCQHSHCIGAHEYYENCHILYGQGNYHFVKPSDNEGWGDGFAVSYDTKQGEIAFHPVVMTEKGIRLATAEEEREILVSFGGRNRSLADGTWIEGWRAFCKSKEEAYRKVIRNACLPESTERQNAHFAHYLDCEAHSDVWRELFPTYNQTNEKE